VKGMQTEMAKVVVLLQDSIAPASMRRNELQI